MKKVISVLLAIMLTVLCAVPAFAAESEEKKYNKDSLLRLADEMELVYIFHYKMMHQHHPDYVDGAEENMKSAIAKIRAEAETYTTDEEFEAGAELLNNCKENMYINASELKFMLDLMQNDYEDNGYYDEATLNEIKLVYENAENAYINGTNSDIHIAYVNMRNELNKLCRLVIVPGDVDKSGDFNVKDISLIQKYLTGTVKFTSEQYFAAGLDKEHNNITTVTNLQKTLAEKEFEPGDFSIIRYIENNIYNLECGFYIYPIDKNEFIGAESTNKLYYINRYYE